VTCIAGIVENGTVYIGGDSAGVAGWSLAVRADAKVWATEEFAFGFTSSFRMGQLLRYKLNPPARLVGQSVDEYMVGPWIDAVRQRLKAGGYARTEEGAERRCGVRDRRPWAQSVHRQSFALYFSAAVSDGQP
jgi:hypothetical protein